VTTHVIDRIRDKFKDAKRDALIPILQELQHEEGCLSEASLKEVSKMLDMPLSKVFGVASFYNQFRFQPIGKYHIVICRGTACHVKGSSKVLEAIKQELKIDAGQTTRDGLFTLDTVACIGACGLAPVISINGEFHAQMTPDKTIELITTIRNNHGNNNKA
jgi:NADH-quinone oxidoreductase E subunit